MKTRGFLTGKVNAAELPDDDFRKLGQPRFSGENLDRNMAMVRALDKLAAERGVTTGQLALAWVQHRGEHVVPIPGTRSITRLEENVAAADLKLSDADLAAIRDILPTGGFGARYAGGRVPTWT